MKKQLVVTLSLLLLLMYGSACWAQGTKWSAYGPLAADTVANDDTFLILDVSDTSLGATGTQKQYTWETLIADLGTDFARSLGGTGFIVDADGDVTGKSFTVPKVDSTAGTSCVYDGNSTDTDQVCWQGPADSTGTINYQFPNAAPSGASGIPYFTAAEPSVMSWLYLNNLAITGGTINNTVIGGSTPAAGTFTTLTGTSVVTSASTTPGVWGQDSESLGADKDMGNIRWNYSGGADTEENADFWIAVTQDGAEDTIILMFDESDDRWETSKAVQMAALSTTADITIQAADPDLIFGDTDGADASIQAESIDATDSRMQLQPNDSAGRTTYIELDGGTETVDILKPAVFTSSATADSVVANSFDATGAVDMDYGSADITDHTFITDGGVDSITIGNNADLDYGITINSDTNDFTLNWDEDNAELELTSVGDEDLVIDLDTATDNEVGIGTGTGVLELDMGTIGLAAGYVDAATPFTCTTTDVDVTVSGNSGTYYNKHASAITYNLPAAVVTATGKGKTFCFRNLVAQVMTINPDNADYFDYATVGPMAAGEAIVSTGAIGEFLCVQGMNDGSNDYWVSWGISGTLAQETP